MSERLTVEEFRLLAPRTGCKPKAKARKSRRMSKADFTLHYTQTPASTASAEERAAQRALFDRHDAATYEFRVPLPPSVNSYFQTAVIGKHASMFVGTAGVAYREAVAATWRDHWNDSPPEPETGRLRLLVTLAFPTRMACDLDNRLKPLQDALQHAGVFANDSQIDDLRVRRGPLTKPVGYADLIVETIYQ